MYSELTAKPLNVTACAPYRSSSGHQFDLAGSARLDVLVSAIKPRQASQIVKDLSELLPLERAKVSEGVPPVTYRTAV